MISLKRYQQNTLDTLAEFLTQARFQGPQAAYQQAQPSRLYQPLTGLEATPYICLRLPTGAGKTLLSAHTVRLAGETYLQHDAPLTLWLVPSDPIKQQTLATLKNPHHPNAQVLQQTFQGRVRVFDVEDFRTIRPQDITPDTCCLIVATFQSLRVNDTEQRKVYAHDENLEPHFTRIPPHAPGMERHPDTGHLKFSFANLLHWHRPLVIIDEAHNAKSPLSIEVLQRINAACVVEYTATPAPNSNVLVAVSAAELKAEEMIKLPIELTEHPTWQEAVSASVHTQKRLEQVAADNDPAYLRPIVLFQAENKDRDVTVQHIKDYLLTQEGIPAPQIAIATGEQKELDQINLYDPACPVRFVITVQALKEGWDCPFAYVLCSVANTRSATAIEQLLGRVLRMPYAKTRPHPDLNKAYAHVASTTWTHAASQLCDRLVSMGFQQLEAQDAITVQSRLWSDTSDNYPLFQQAPPSLVIPNLTAPLDLTHLTQEEQATIIQEPTATGTYSLTVTAPTVNESLDRLIEKLVSAAPDPKDRKELALRAAIHRHKYGPSQSPAQRGEPFSVPQLCLQFGDDELELAEPESFRNLVGWHPMADYTPLTPTQFSPPTGDSRAFTIDLHGKTIAITPTTPHQQLTLDGLAVTETAQDLCLWLDRKLRDPYTNQSSLLAYLRRTVDDLLARDDITLAHLCHGKFLLATVLESRLNTARQAAAQRGIQQMLDAHLGARPRSLQDFHCHFHPHRYPANDYYTGRYHFTKHYYPQVAAMNAEEADCAAELDAHPAVKFWVRNLERQPTAAFWLPTATDRFYPDFVAQLTDGRHLVVEYKGAHLNNADTQEKALIGRAWAEASGNLFLMAWQQDDKNRPLKQQLATCLGALVL